MKFLLKTFSLLSLFGLIYLNISFYHQPDFKTDSKAIYNADVYNQLQFLKRKLNEGAAEKMQRYYPEGYLFIYSLYGLTWTNLIEKLPAESPIFKEGMIELEKTVTAVDSKSAKQIFNPLLPLRYGAFYAGWSSYVMGSKLLIDKDPDQKQLYYFKNKCYEIADALKAAPLPFLESYANQTWPADNMVCIAALVKHDQIFEPEFEDVIQNWLKKVKQKVDPKTGLIPHVVRSETGEGMGSVRGNSQSLMLIFLHEIDPIFAKAQFEIYKELFLDSRFFLPGIREYPKGISDWGDVDSGPVILDIGGAASIVGQRTFGLFGEHETHEGLRNCIEGFGVGYTIGGEKKYIFGMLPMADAFIAWVNSAENADWQKSKIDNWRLNFQLLSCLLIFMIGVIFVRLRKK